MPQSGILKRMTPSIIITIFANKIIVELKRSLNDIWVSNLSDTSKRQKIEKLTYDTFNALDPSKSNTNHYKELFKSMNDKQFKSFCTYLFDNPNEYLVCTMVDYERELTIETVEAAANVLGIPLFEKVFCPHITLNKNKVVATKEPVPVGYCNIKRVQQMVSKKNGMSTSIDERSATTGQVTSKDKNGRETDLENAMLISLGAEAILRELNGPKADDMVMKQQMMNAIMTKGYVSEEDMESDTINKTALNTADVYLTGMGIGNDLVTPGLMLKRSMK